MVANKRVRIADIAAELGLSTATVSNVLHGKTDKVSRETAARVMALVEAREYIPSMAGILLAQNDAPIIGVVINDHEKYEAHALEDVFIASSLQCLCAQIEARGRFMMVKRSKSPGEIIRFASMWNMEGLVLIGYCDQDYEELRSQMRVPFVIYDGYVKRGERLCNISIDHYDGGRQVGAYFKRQGHERALCVADNYECMDKERWEGFRDGFGEGASFWQMPMQHGERARFWEERLDRLMDYTAVFAVSDDYAVELLRFLALHGVRVPERMAVAGFDDAPICRKVFPSLTTVRQDGELRARVAMEKLMALAGGEATENRVVLPVTLIERESTALPQKGK